MRKVGGKRQSHALVISVLALLVALSGGAWAAATIGPGDIKKNAVRAKHINPDAVRPKHINRNAVRSNEIKDESIALRDIKPATRAALRGKSGVSVVGQASFHPLRSSTTHEFDSAGGRLCVEGYPWFEAEFPDLPAGATLQRFQFFAFDSSSSENLTGFVKRTTHQDFGGPVLTVLATFASFGSGGFQSAVDFVDEDDATDDAASTYSVVVRLDGQEAASCSEGDSLRIIGAHAKWVRE